MSMCLFVPNESNSLNSIQKCNIENLQLFLELVGDNFIQSFASIQLPNQNVNFLVRLCTSGKEDAALVLKCDMRVKELKSCLSSDGKFCESIPEIDLARHIVKEENQSTSSEGKKLLSSMRFNDLLRCTPSKDIKMLKSDTIKMMRLTVICSSDLHYKSEAFKKEEDDDDPLLKSKGTTHSMSPKWKLLTDKIRDIFQTYDIHIKSNTLVDCRSCPLAKLEMSFSPSVSFVFVQQCVFKNPQVEIGKIVSQTRIHIDIIHHIDHYKQLLAYESFDSQLLAGLQASSKILSDIIQLKNSENLKKRCQINCNLGALIIGSSGSGKTLLVKSICDKHCVNLIAFNISTELVKGVGAFSESISQVFTKAIYSAMKYSTVLLLEDIDLFHADLKGSGSYSQSNADKDKLVNHLCNLINCIPPSDEIMLTLVATTNKPHRVPEKLRRSGRLEVEIYIGVPNEQDRLEILKSLSNQMSALKILDLSSLAKLTPGYVGTDLIRLSHLAILKSNEENCTVVAESHIKYALSRILPSVLHGSLGVVDIQRTTSLDDIIGLEKVKAELIKAIVWPLKHPSAFLRLGILPSKGILLHGKPGVGKTCLVRAISGSHQTNFLSVSAAELFSSAVGDSEKIIAHLFHRARMASPCILFIDEFESIVGSREMSSAKGKSVNESILSMLLTEMDGIGSRLDTMLSNQNDFTSGRVIVVAATNKPQLIDSALLRPGRFDRLVHVPLPNEQERALILTKYLEKIPLNEDVDIMKLAEASHLYSGADLMNLCREAALFALAEDMGIQSVSARHFIKERAHF